MRAELASTAFAIGCHAEVYSDFLELGQSHLQAGIVMARDNRNGGGIARLMSALTDAGIWLPVIAFDDEVEPDRIVEAMKVGALDYLSLPLGRDKLRDTLETVEQEAVAFGVARQKLIKARGRIANLSRREREVLDWLTNGCSNKQIARELAISPRTVEIHRSNMMTKLGANHAAEAVRMRLESEIALRKTA